MRIVLITPEYPPAERMGGIGTNTATVARALARRGEDVSVVTRGEPAMYSDGDVHVIRLDPRWIPEPHVRRLLALRQTARAVRRLRPDLVQAPEWEAEAWWLARWTRVPVITRLATPTYMLDELNFGQMRARTAFIRRLERDQARRSAAIFAPTAALAERVAADWELDRERVDVIPSPVDVAEVRRLASGEKRTEAPDDALVFIGRLERRKGIAELGRALPGVLAAHPALHAVLIGRDSRDEGGRVMDTFWSDVAAVRERIHVLGELPRDQALPVVGAARLVVLPSLWENLANAALEAMALGRPVVATRAGGFPELIEEGRTGWLVEAGDAEALGEELIRRLGDRAELERVGREAARRAGEFDVDPAVERLLDLYRRVLAERRGFDETVYTRDYRRYFHPEEETDPFRALYEQKRRAVVALFADRSRLRILDVGGGYGRIAGPLSKRHDVTLVDISPEMLSEARERWPRLALVEADARSLPFEDASFDAVLAIDLLPHLRDLRAALHELARVAAPGGEVIVDTTNASPWWVPVYPAYYNRRPKRLLLTMLAGGVLPEWRARIRHHRPREMRPALAAAGLRLEAVRRFGPAWSAKWHLWLTRKD